MLSTAWMRQRTVITIEREREVSFVKEKSITKKEKIFTQSKLYSIMFKSNNLYVCNYFKALMKLKLIYHHVYNSFFLCQKHNYLIYFLTFLLILQLYNHNIQSSKDKMVRTRNINLFDKPSVSEIQETLKDSDAVMQFLKEHNLKNIRDVLFLPKIIDNNVKKSYPRGKLSIQFFFEYLIPQELKDTEFLTINSLRRKFERYNKGLINHNTAGNFYY